MNEEELSRQEILEEMTDDRYEEPEVEEPAGLKNKINITLIFIYYMIIVTASSFLTPLKQINLILYALPSTLFFTGTLLLIRLEFWAFKYNEYKNRQAIYIILTILSASLTLVTTPFLLI